MNRAKKRQPSPIRYYLYNDNSIYKVNILTNECCYIDFNNNRESWITGVPWNSVSDERESKLLTESEARKILMLEML